MKNDAWCGLLAVILAFADSCTVGAPGAVVDVYDGFETSEVTTVWDTDRFVPGAVQMETDIVRAGRGSARITVRPNDKFEAGINGKSDSERAELREARKLSSKEDEPYEYSFSVFIPTNFPIVPTRLVIAQWKQDCPDGRICSDDSPVLAIRYSSGVLSITQDIGNHRMILYKEESEFRNRWLDFRLQVQFSPKDLGRIRAWLGDRQVVDYSGVTANPENAATGYPSPSWFYFKMGLYRNVLAEPMTIYIDEYRKKQVPEKGF